MSLSSTLLPVPLRPSTARVSPRFTAQADPIQNLVTFKGLVQILDGDDTRIALSFRLLWLASQCHRLWPYSFHRSLNHGLVEDNENEFNQHNIGQDHEERGENY